jgi:octaprenyl-diphosphate synthase
MSESATELSPLAVSDAASATFANPGALLERSMALVADDLVLAERRLRGLLESSIAVIPAVVGHLAFAGGKRFRPLLTLLCARAAGLTDPARITVAAVGELLHTATLLHDDVVDDGAFRRGRPAARVAHGNGMAVLSGDYCLARSLQAIAMTGHARAITTLADTVTRMAEGEVAQLDHAGDFSLDRERYAAVIERKTAALIEWCSTVADLVDERHVEALRAYGYELGFAFQIADDVLDVRAPTEGLGAPGKDPGQDLRDGKMTLPIIIACERDAALRRRVEVAMREGPPMSTEVVEALLRAILRTDAVSVAAAEAMDHAERAIAALEVLPASDARDALMGVAYYVVRRDT